ncbi:hypothetical protein [Marinobacterium jannaschii]|uniref:hypothetical protein n=1 Tax=Marinobacterium jannaschii TaxID=64970 RepID=UPI0012EB36E9|nr:hypothetical protein [Marinobacterium jannaschii]
MKTYKALALLPLLVSGCGAESKATVSEQKINNCKQMINYSSGHDLSRLTYMEAKSDGSIYIDYQKRSGGTLKYSCKSGALSVWADGAGMWLKI